MRPEFWKTKRVLVTGHTGFKGSWLCLWLQQLRAEVSGYALAPPSEPNLFTAARVGAGMRSFIGDVRDLKTLTAFLREVRPQILIHMAAQSLVRASYRDPVGTYATNVMGAVNLLEAARQVAGVRVVLNVTTDKCYEERDGLRGYREDEPLGGPDPYSSSKSCAELVTAAYRRSFLGSAALTAPPVAVATARAGNVIGGGDWAADRLIPDVVRAFRAGQPVNIRNPHAVRPWQHVLEPLAGYLSLIERLWDHGSEYSEAWNFGPRGEDARPVTWIVEQAVRLWGEGATWKSNSDYHPHEAARLELDCSKARSRLGWAPLLSVEVALKDTFEWYLADRGGAEMRQLTLRQIDLYQELCRA